MNLGDPLQAALQVEMKESTKAICDGDQKEESTLTAGSDIMDANPRD